MAKILWTPAGHAEVLKMGPRLRRVDKDEIRVVRRRGKDKDIDIGQALLDSSYLSRAVYVGRDASDPTSPPFILYGVADDELHVGYGVIWMVCTPEIKKYRRALLRDAPGRIQWIHDRKWYPRGLHNFVLARNELHLKWLKRMGAIFPRTDRIALINGEPFTYFRFLDV